MNGQEGWGDECWRWEGKRGVKERLIKRVEKLRLENDERQRKFVDVEKLREERHDGTRGSALQRRGR